MAFKSVKQYNDERFANWFLLRNDGEYADVVFLYRDYADVLVADVHYIKSDEYSGYVQCIGRDCPVCATGKIRVQQKLFIPVYNITQNEIQFWDRSFSFENQLNTDVFSKYPDASNYVFRIKRSGAYRDLNTSYSIQAIGKNTESYDQILAKFNVTLPEHYEVICKDYSAAKLSELLSNFNSSDLSAGADLPSYQVTPRAAANTVVPEVHDTVPAEDAVDNSMLPADDLDPINSDDDLDDDVSF